MNANVSTFDKALSNYLIELLSVTASRTLRKEKNYSNRGYIICSSNLDAVIDASFGYNGNLNANIDAIIGSMVAIIEKKLQYFLLSK